MKKITINLSLVLLIFVIYFLQLNFFDWFTIAEIKPNLFIILVLFIGLFASRNIGTIYGVLIGLFLDLMTGQIIGINALVYGILGLIAGIFDKNFSKDNRITIMIMVAGATMLTELVIYILNYIFMGINLDVAGFIRILIIEAIFNLILSIIIYPLIQKFGYYIENEYKGNKILTRYF